MFCLFLGGKSNESETCGVRLELDLNLRPMDLDLRPLDLDLTISIRGLGLADMGLDYISVAKDCS